MPMNQTQNIRSSQPVHISHIVNENDLLYVSRVLMMLREMKFDEVRPMDKASSNYERFVNAVKSIINARLDRTFDFEIEFNPDCTKLKKLRLFTTISNNTNL